MSGPQHGQSRTALYKVWTAMLQRCECPTNPRYLRYGARGIRVCERWRQYVNFAEDMGKRPAGKITLERVDNDGDYEPGNCRWATYTEQARNKSTNRILAWNGRTAPLTQWAEELQIPAHVLFARLDKLRWPIGRALSTPARKLRRVSTVAAIEIKRLSLSGLSGATISAKTGVPQDVISNILLGKSHQNAPGPNKIKHSRTRGVTGHE